MSKNKQNHVSRCVSKVWERKNCTFHPSIVEKLVSILSEKHSILESEAKCFSANLEGKVVNIFAGSIPKDIVSYFVVWDLYFF